MRLAAGAALTALTAGYAHAFAGTTPVVSFAPSRAECSDQLIVLSVEGLHHTHLSGGEMPEFRRLMSAAAHAADEPYAKVAEHPLVAHIEKCALDLHEAPYSHETHDDLAVALSSAPGAHVVHFASPVDAALSRADALLASVVLGRNARVVLTHLPAQAHRKRALSSLSSPPPAKQGLLHNYVFFTPPLLTGTFFVSCLTVPVILLGVSALMSIQTPRGLETKMLGSTNIDESRG